MPHPTEPVGVDLAAFLSESQISHTLSTGTLDTYAGTGVRRFGDETGWQPFLAPTADQTREFDPPGRAGFDLAYTRGGGRTLVLRAGLVTLTSLTVDSVAKTVNTDFWTRPTNHVEETWPIEIIEFRSPVYGEPRSIAITGRWGFSDTIPDDAYLAMLEFAACAALAPIWAGVTGGRTSYSDEEVTEKFADSPFGGMGKQMEAHAMETAHRYRRMSVWF